jgi:cyclopropane-fatty-acyl-phospholipid synthase
MSTAERDSWGGSRAAIQHHYDLSNDFYALWLDETRTYSCALWQGPEDPADLASAQRSKIDHHVRESGAAGKRRVLDVGCGWGSTLRRLTSQHGVSEAVGLTLSDAQANFIEARQSEGVTVLRESWTTHQPVHPYDAVISVGAFEHFAKPTESVAERIAVYRSFFERVASWLVPGGRLSLQTIAYGTMRPEEASAFMQTEIFPDSELPRLGDIVAAAEGVMEIVAVRNDRLDYARTCDLWLQGLRANHAAALAMVGAEAVQRYQQYLKLATVGFRMGKLNLLRLTLRPVVRGWRGAATSGAV